MSYGKWIKDIEQQAEDKVSRWLTAVLLALILLLVTMCSIGCTDLNRIANSLEVIALDSSANTENNLSNNPVLSSKWKADRQEVINKQAQYYDVTWSNILSNLMAGNYWMALVGLIPLLIVLWKKGAFETFAVNAISYLKGDDKGVDDQLRTLAQQHGVYKKVKKLKARI